METIKQLLADRITNDDQLREFLAANSDQLKTYVVGLWEQQFPKEAENTEPAHIDNTENTQPEEDCQPINPPESGSSDDCQSVNPSESGSSDDCQSINPSETGSSDDCQSINPPETGSSDDCQPVNPPETGSSDDCQPDIAPESTNQTEKPADMQKVFGAGAPTTTVQPVYDQLAFKIMNEQITFMNGKVNNPYCIDFDLETKMPEISEVSFEGLEKIGLRYSAADKQIKGTPTQPGDHKIKMWFKRKDWTEGKPLLQREVLFIINPDPRVLWSKNIPTPQEIDYYKPDCDSTFIHVAAQNIKMIAASQRGRSHAIEGKPRDDDFALHFDDETGCYIMIVADGAGSAKYSRKGSQLACQTAMHICRERLLAGKDILLQCVTRDEKNEIAKLMQEAIGHAVFESYKAIEKEASEHGAMPKDYATTLMMGVCKKYDYGWFVASWWVGDGGIGIYDQKLNSVKILGEPDGGEFAGQTRFLTMPDIIRNELYKRMRFEIAEDFTAIILMTDGITDPKFETDANLYRIEKWNALWDDLTGENEDGIAVDFAANNEQTSEQLLHWLDFWSKGNHDDRTIAVMY